MADETRQGWKGIDNRNDPARIGKGWLQKAENVDLDNTGKALRRGGRVKKLTGQRYRNMWPPKRIEGVKFALCTHGTDLKKLTKNVDGSIAETVLRSDMQQGRYVSYAYAAGDIYYCNGRQQGMIRDGADTLWGVPTPAVQPTVSPTTGALNPGRYQVTCTFVDKWGREGGATAANGAKLTSIGGLSLNRIPESGHPDIETVRVYITGPDDAKFYLAREVTDGTTSLSITAGLHWTIPLQTHFLNPPPADAKLVAYDNGRLWVVAGNYLHYSMPQAYHLFDYHHFFPFEAEPNLILPVPNYGLIVGADRTYFIPTGFADPDNVPQRILADYRCLPGSGAHIGGEDVGEDRNQIYALWGTEKGVCMMGPQGSFRNITEERYDFGPASRAAGIVREINGYVQFLMMVKQATGDSNVYINDKAGATVIKKNGITL